MMIMNSRQAAGMGINGSVEMMCGVLSGPEAQTGLCRSGATLERPRIRRLAYAGNAAPPGGSPPL
jgi:hypothetical protein